jgi:hypothetical protein
MSYRKRDVLKGALDEMDKVEVVRPSISPWAAPVVIVPKKDGTDRTCIDYREFNKVAVFVAHPLPKINDILASFENKIYFSSLDLTKGFWQIGLTEETIPKTAFTTVFGQYEFTRLPFGLNSAPAIFQSVMRETLAGILDVHVYIDDIIIASATFDHHLETLDTVLGRLEDVNLKAKLQKCEFARTELLYLGHIINSCGISTDPEKVSAVRDLPEPTCVHDIEVFLGKVNYYSRFIPEYSKVAKPLFDLKRKEAQWNFGKPELEAFNKLKDALCTAPVLRHPDLQKEFQLATDASGYGLGAVLSQIHDGDEHPVAYASRTLKDAETRYAVIEKEGLAVFWAIQHFEEYLDGAHFTVYTDHEPLLAMNTKPQVNKKLLDWSDRLSHLHFTIKYKPGKTNKNADMLSRYPVVPLKGRRSKLTQSNESQWNHYDPLASLADDISKPPRHQKRAVLTIATRGNRGEAEDSSQGERAASETNAQQKLENIATEQRKTPLYGALLNYLIDHTVPLDPSLAKEVLITADFYSVGPNGQLLRIRDGRTQLCVPRTLVDQVLHDSHNVDAKAHGGVSKTMAQLRSDYWWPEMAKDTLNYVKNCGSCLAHKYPARKTKQPLGQRPIPDSVWSRLHLDIWSPGGLSARNHVCVVAFIDAFSKFLVAGALLDHHATTIVDFFIQKVVCVHGMPLELISDGAPELRGKLQQELSKMYGITRKITTPYRPQANGQIERIFATIRPMLATLSSRSPKNWDLHLPLVVHAYNASYHHSIKNTPFYIMYGRDAIPHVYANADLHELSSGTMKLRANMLKLARSVVAENLAKEQIRSKEFYDASTRPQTFNISDVVLIRTILPPKVDVRKLYARYVGPYRIRSVLNGVLGVVPLLTPQGTPRYIHADRVIHCPVNVVLDQPMDQLLSPFFGAATIDPNLEQESAE